MDWSLGAMLQLGLRILAHRRRIELLWPRVAQLFAAGQQLYPELKSLLDDIAPGFALDTQPQQLDVRWLQQALNILTDAKLTVDGDYGEATRAAVRAFQAAQGLDADGWAGILTEAAILQGLKDRGGDR